MYNEIELAVIVELNDNSFIINAQLTNTVFIVNETKDIQMRCRNGKISHIVVYKLIEDEKKRQRKIKEDYNWSLKKKTLLPRNSNSCHEI